MSENQGRGATLARAKRLVEELERRVLVIDGAMGTMIQAANLGPDDFGGEALEGCNENLCATRPDVIRSIHDAYLAAGADIIETNTFGSTALVLAEYDLADQAFVLTAAAARIAREAADAVSTPERPRFVAGSMGPTTRALSVTGGTTFDELHLQFREQARALIEGGVDYLLLETCQDTRNVKAGLLGIRELFDQIGYEVPVAVSVTIEPMGTMLAGQGVDALVASLEHVPLLYIGLNCATGPEFMTDHIRALSELARTRVACVPNAGLPDEDGNYLETPPMVAKVVGRFLGEGWLNLVGGCCGTRAAHIEALSAIAKDATPRAIPDYQRTLVSGVELLEVEESNRPVLVGERTNVIGSRAFKELIVAEKFEEASEIARRQVKGGAQVIDVCLANPDRDELEDVTRFLGYLIHKVKAPLMIDSTDAEVIAASLPFCQGKSVINSINLEDGEERFEAVVPLGRRYGAAFVVGCIDEDKLQGMAVTRQRKLEVAQRSYDLLTKKYGVAPSDIIFDPLVFPCATGDRQYVGSALETVEGLRLIKQAMPLAKTILGISNVSFGLPAAGREVLNSVFLYHCTKAGLDMAIVNTEKLERYPSIPDHEKKLAEILLFETSDEAIANFTDAFRERRVKASAASNLTLDQRLANYILEGSKDGLVADLDLALTGKKPLEIINGPLMAGMDEVGRLFNKNELIVAEVLQSAEAMKAAVRHLEPFMEKSDTASRGKVLLATVKGDVHDIGKNLVDIILGNNGFEIVNLGIKVPPHELVAAIKREKPDIVGLSGLLVKSAQMMVLTVEEFEKEGIRVPVLVGGAALTRNFTRRRIATAYPNGMVAYARDAMNGLALAQRIVDPAGLIALELELADESARLQSARESAAVSESDALPVAVESKVRVLEVAERAAVPDYDRHVLQTLSVDDIWRFINPAMLYNRHLGFKGKWDVALAAGDPKARDLAALIDEVKVSARGFLKARAVYRFFEADRDGDTLRLFTPGATSPLGSFTFPRQKADDGLCIADYLPPSGSGRDVVALFVTTAGDGIRDRATALKDAGEYVRAHALQALAIETAEAAGEWLHSKIRSQWGHSDPPSMTMPDRFQVRYRGRRYSFGYPACPALEDQAPLFRLLDPKSIGVELTDGFMMEPEASVSALVVHHPEAKYFSVE